MQKKISAKVAMPPSSGDWCQRDIACLFCEVLGYICGFSNILLPNIPYSRAGFYGVKVTVAGRLSLCV